MKENRLTETDSCVTAHSGSSSDVGRAIDHYLRSFDHRMNTRPRLHVALSGHQAYHTLSSARMRVLNLVIMQAALVNMVRSLRAIQIRIKEDRSDHTNEH